MAGTPSSSRSSGPTQLAYAQLVADVAISAVAEAAPDDVLSSGAVTYDGSRIAIEFFSPRVIVGATAGSFTLLNLWDDATDLGRLLTFSLANVNAPAYGVRYLTPTAGAHTYRIRGWRVNSNGTVSAGAGAPTDDLPAYIRVAQAPA